MSIEDDPNQRLTLEPQEAAFLGHVADQGADENLSPGARKYYDLLTAPDIEPEASEQERVDAADIRNEKTVPPASTSLRVGYWNKPTPEQVEKAAKFGYDLAAQDKYYS